jgi:hypothetical protein
VVEAKEVHDKSHDHWGESSDCGDWLPKGLLLQDDRLVESLGLVDVGKVSQIRSLAEDILVISHELENSIFDWVGELGLVVSCSVDSLGRKVVIGDFEFSFHDLTNLHFGEFFEQVLSLEIDLRD